MKFYLQVGQLQSNSSENVNLEEAQRRRRSQSAEDDVVDRVEISSSRGRSAAATLRSRSPSAHRPYSQATTTIESLNKRLEKVQIENKQLKKRVKELGK